MHYYVYIHKTPNNKFYVGITRQTPSMRWRRGHGYRNNKHFYNAILKYGWDNISHDVIEVYTEEWMYELEQVLISWFQSNNSKYGYNRSIGGEKSSLKHTDDERKIQKQQLKEYHRIYNNQYYKDHPNKMKQYRESRKNYLSQYYKDHKDKINSHMHQYYKDHKDEIKQTCRHWCDEHKNYLRNYYTNHHRKYREKKRLQK